MPPFSRINDRGLSGNRGFTSTRLGLPEQKSIYFDGIDNAADSDQDILATIGQAQSFSFSVWLKTAGAFGSFSDVALLTEPPNGANGPHAFSNGTSLYQTVNTFNASSNAKAAVPASATWTHVTGSYDKANSEIQRLYVNGVTTNQGSNSDGDIINTDRIWAWGRSLVTGNFREVYVCQIAFWSSQLSTADHIALYGGGSIVEAKNVSPTTLVQWNRIDENDDLESAGGIRDYSGKGNTVSGVNLTNASNLSSDTP